MSREASITADRLAKKASLIAQGVDVYPAKSQRTHLIVDFLSKFDKLSNTKVVLAGRVRSLRVHGQLAFIDITDASGKVQLYLKVEDLDVKTFELSTELLDEGDFIEARGVAVVTKTGASSLAVSELRILAKSLKAVPREHFGLKDKEERFRKRYLDLILDDRVRLAFERRSQLILALRSYLDQCGFIEVETPILQTLPGGALARPFKTHLNALDLPLYLRVAPELYLKRLIIGGFEKVFELGRAFRNEGMDASHNPEFTILEFYWAYAERDELMDFTERMIRDIAKNLLKGTDLVVAGQTVNFDTPWPRVGFLDLLKDHTGFEFDAEDQSTLKVKAESLGLKIPEGLSKGKIADELFKKICRPKIMQPTFVVDHPLDISPLAKVSPTNPTTASRFQVVIAGNEYVNAYNELNDPIEQAKRFKEQEEAAASGDTETQPFDADYIEALEYGMPPTAGWGLGVDRLAALFAGMETLREIILFPTMKPRD